MSKIIGVTVGTPLSASSVANALKGKKSGEVVSLTDVSPLEHEMKVGLKSDTLTDFSTVTLKKCGKNLFDASKLVTECGWKEENGYLVGTAQSAHDKFGPKKTEGFMSLEGIDTVSISFRGYMPAGAEGKVGLYFLVVYDDGTEKSLGGLKNTTETLVTGSSLPNKKPKKLYLTFNNYNNDCYIKDIQLEIGTMSTEYEPYHEEIYTDINADGTVDGVTSLYPNTTLLTDTAGVTIEAEYNVDTKKYIDKKFAELQALVLEV